ncbi:MAG TPA: glycosyltransferase, partial [Thermoanaerobaculia bacterium]|nr:glycosyltransferase [Thermoanaerobaculia bacterium]
IRPLRQRVLAEIRPPKRPQPPGRPERVLHVVHGWPPWNHAGTEMYAAWLARRQAEVRDVAVYSRIADPERAHGDAVETLDRGVRVRSVVNNFTQRDPLSRNGLRDRTIEADFARFLDQFNPRVVHVHHLAGHSAGLLRVAARRKVPVVYQVQDWWAPCARVNLFDAWRRLCSGPGIGKCSACRPLTGVPPAPVLNRLLYSHRLSQFRKLLGIPEAFVMGSRFILDSYLELGFLDKDSLVFVIPYGVELGPIPDARPARTPGAPLRFGLIGSILPHKGIHVAVEAFAGIDPARATLTVWGDPSIDPDYTRELEGLRGPGTEVRERFEDDRKAEVFGSLDALIVPSLGLESFGLVAREAMHHSVPVLATRRGALSEMFLGGDFGALFNPEEPAELRGWIERLAADPGILDRWRERLPTVKGMEQHTEEMEQVYEKVLADKILLDRTLTGKFSRKKGKWPATWTKKRR